MTKIGVLGLIALAAGCGAHHDPLIGKWSATIPRGASQVKIAYEFKPDGTGSQTMTLMGLTIAAQFTYTHTNDALSETVTQASLNGRAVPNAAVHAPTGQMHYTISGDTLTLRGVNSGHDIVVTRQN